MGDFCAFCCREQIGDVYGENSEEMMEFEDVISYLDEISENTATDITQSDTYRNHEDEAIEIELDLEKDDDDEAANK